MTVTSGGDVRVEPAAPRLPHFPVTFFATVMGVAGLALAWHRAAPVLGVPAMVGTALFWLSLSIYIAVLVTYAAKLWRHPAAVLAELRHPVRLAFVPTMTIALLLVATAGLEVVPRLAAVLWWVAMPLQLVVTLFVLTAWIGRQTFGQEHVTPAWFIPVVGVVVVPLVGVSVGPPEISWFFFSVGVVSWMALLPVVLGRLLLHGQELPAKLVPTLAVLVAPPAVAFLALLRLLPAQSPAPIARVLYYAALFFALLVLAQIGALRRAPFALSWWAYSFPAAALTVATLVMAREPGGMFLHVLAWMLLVGTSLLVAVLTVRTVVAMLRGRICVPE